MKTLVMPAKAGIQCLLIGLSALAYAQDAPAPNAKDLAPRPAEIAPRAAKSLLLAVTRAGERFVAVGDRGTILLSGDGTTWEQVAAPVHATLTTVSFADANTGWAAGHDAAILHTTDGGRTWKLQNFEPELSKPVLALLALDAPALLEEGLHLNSMIRLGNGELFIAGETGLLGVSADGAAWKRLTLPYEGSLFGALPRGDKGALVFGLRGNVLYSDDVRAGKWTRVDTQTVHSMFGGTLLPEGGAALAGADGEILAIDAAGAVRKAHAPQGGSLSAVLPYGSGLLVVGENGATKVKL
jgi:photosystem II stability/assembly factor-like uncharacterized protein